MENDRNNEYDKKYIDFKKSFELIVKEDNKKKKYVFKCDYDDVGIFDVKFELTVLPHQWWGNIKNPKVVFLAINPGYKAGSDELDTLLFDDLILKNYDPLENNFQYLFGNCGNGKADISFRYSSTSCWWRSVFDEIIPNDLVDSDNDTIKRINNNVGFFNLVGYQSKNSQNLYFNCKSTKKIVHYINDLPNQNNILFIFVWGKNKWENCGLHVKNYIEINKPHNITQKICGQNKYLKIKITDEKDRKIFRGFLMNDELVYKDFEEFLNNYNTLKD